MAAYDDLLAYFHQDVLAAYRNQPDKYSIATDYFEGSIETVELVPGAETERDEEQYIDIKFGYRTLADGALAVVVFAPDLSNKLGGEHLHRWLAFRLNEPQWPVADDERFTLWVHRYLDGSWDVDNGPRYYLGQRIEEISALTSAAVGAPLFVHDSIQNIYYPLAQNTHCYQDAHQALYGLVVDGLNKQALVAIGAFQKRSINLSSANTVQGLRKLDILRENSSFWRAVDNTSKQRRFAAHGDRPPAKRSPAFERFSDDLREMVTGLGELQTALEALFGADGATALCRQQATQKLPKIERPAKAHFAVCKIENLVGRTVERVEYGFRRRIKRVHDSEAIILHLSDGSVLGIDTGSNAFNIASDRRDIEPEDFHVDFMVTWVPPLT